MVYTNLSLGEQFSYMLRPAQREKEIISVIILRFTDNNTQVAVLVNDDLPYFKVHFDKVASDI